MRSFDILFRIHKKISVSTVRCHLIQSGRPPQKLLEDSMIGPRSEASSIGGMCWYDDWVKGTPNWQVVSVFLFVHMFRIVTAVICLITQKEDGGAVMVNSKLETSKVSNISMLHSRRICSLQYRVLVN